MSSSSSQPLIPSEVSVSDVVVPLTLPYYETEEKEDSKADATTTSLLPPLVQPKKRPPTGKLPVNSAISQHNPAAGDGTTVLDPESLTVEVPLKRNRSGGSKTDGNKLPLKRPRLMMRPTDFSESEDW